MDRKSGTRSAARRRRADSLFHGPLSMPRQFRRRTIHIAYLAHTRYIIFIIRARDTRSRAGFCMMHRCRLIAFKALREPRRWGRLLSCLLVALQSNQNTTRVRERPNVMRNAPRVCGDLSEETDRCFTAPLEYTMKDGKQRLMKLHPTFFFLVFYNEVYSQGQNSAQISRYLHCRYIIYYRETDFFY